MWWKTQHFVRSILQSLFSSIFFISWVLYFPSPPSAFPWLIFSPLLHLTLLPSLWIIAQQEWEMDLETPRNHQQWGKIGKKEPQEGTGSGFSQKLQIKQNAGQGWQPLSGAGNSSESLPRTAPLPLGLHKHLQDVKNGSTFKSDKSPNPSMYLLVLPS